MRIPRPSRSTLAGRGVDPPDQPPRPRTRAGATIAWRLTALGSLALALPLALPGVVSADVLDAASRFTARFDGSNAADQAGIVIANIGDQNGDGRPDFAVGIPEASNSARDNSGSVYVLYSPPTPGLIDLASLAPTQGYRIDGADNFDATGSSVGPAGDVNGDGVMDFIIGAPGASNNDRNGSGTAWIVFGGPRANVLDLSMIGVNGIEIDGAKAGDSLGAAVASAGDVNGDGAPDFLLGSPGTDIKGGTNSGSVYLLFGPAKGDTTTIDLNGLNQPSGTVTGYRIDGGTPGIGVGGLMANVGDQNGDGVPDMAIAVPGAGNNERGNSGSVYVVFGQKAPMASLTLQNLGGAGYRVDGASPGDALGSSISAVGDMNGDGLPDLLLGAPSASYRARAGSGSAFVVFSPGKASTVDLASLGAGGFRIDGATAGEAAGTSVAAAGDLNKDGRPDILIGAPGAGNNNRESSGSAYVVVTAPGTGAIDLDALGANGTRIDGAAAGDNLGLTIQSAGDQNGDGVPDVLVGAPSAGFNARGGSGSVYLVPTTVGTPVTPGPGPGPGPGPVPVVPPVLSPAAQDLQAAFGQVAAQPHRAQFNIVLRALVSDRRKIRRTSPILDQQLPVGGNVRVYGRTASASPQRASATEFLNLVRGHLRFVTYDGTTYAARNGGRFRTIAGPFGILLHALQPESLGQDPGAVVGGLTNIVDRGYARVGGLVTEHYQASLADAALKAYLTSAFSTLGLSPRLVPGALKLLTVKRNTLDVYVQRATRRILAESLALDVTVDIAKLAKLRRLPGVPRTALMTFATRGQVKLTDYGRRVAIVKPTVSGRPATIIDLLRLG